ncbi:MAG: MBL fold metallo-hydrolase [Pseudomonadota bacterium]
MSAIRLGDFVIHRVVEMSLPFLEVDKMFPASTPGEIDALLPRLQPWAIDADRKALVAVQAYLVRTPRHLILLDTCIGCDKTYPIFPFWEHRQDTTWLDRLARAGAQPEEITHVLCSHLHVDHAGWNTRLIDGRWVPTFPNAQYFFAREEVGAAEEREPDIWRESVSPVIEAGQAVIVDSDHQIEDGIWFEPTPGHTQGHVAIHLESQGQRAVMWGDLLHSPVQCAHPHWAYRRDWDGTQSTTSRRRVLETCAAHRHLILSSHFPSPSIGHVRHEGDGFWFDPSED